MSINGSSNGGVNHQSDMRFLVEKNADGIIVVDEDGVLLFANPAAQQIFGRSMEALLGSAIGIPAIPSETADIAVHRPDGTKIDVEIRAVESVWDERPTRLVSVRDVSARRALEEQLRHAAKMEAVGRLTAGIAHDFNNLLTVVIGNLEVARRQVGANDPALTKSLDSASHGAKRAALLTERLLAFARRKPLDPRPFDANMLVAGMSDMLQRTLGERITIATELAPGVLAIDADPTELEAAILNLAVNARDAMPEGGTLLIRTAIEKLAAEAEVAPGSYVMIAVSDTGVGMEADVLAQAFEPFFTTKRDGQGTGLGLSHVYGFVRQSGGHAKLESQTGAGTTVKIYLPELPASAALNVEAVEATVVPERLPPGNGETVLVVEDNEAVRAYTTGCLRDLGYRVLEAADGATALDILDSQPTLRLLLTDLGLPGNMDGRAVTDKAHAVRPQLPVLLMTAYAGEALLHEGRLDRKVDVLNKPFTPSALATRVYQMLHRQRGAPHVLVVEDEPMVRMFIVDVLTERGCVVEEAESGMDALTKYRDGPHYDTAIIDLGLPDCRGDELVAQFRAIDPDFRVILATGYAGTTLMERFQSDTRLQILGKPFDAAQLQKALQLSGLELKDRHGSE